MFSKAQKKPKKKGKQSRWKTLFTLREEERSVLAWQRHGFSAWDELQWLGVALWWRSCHEPLKKTHTVKLKSSQLNSTEPDPVAEARCASRETQINTCWELVFYRDNLWLCVPASKNTPPQGAPPTRNIPASLEIWEHRGGKKSRGRHRTDSLSGSFNFMQWCFVLAGASTGGEQWDKRKSSCRACSASKKFISNKQIKSSSSNLFFFFFIFSFYLFSL